MTPRSEKVHQRQTRRAELDEGSIRISRQHSRRLAWPWSYRLDPELRAAVEARAQIRSTE
jgi:hypothetical protein